MEDIEYESWEDNERLLFGESREEFFDAIDRGEISPKGKSL